MLAFLKPCTGAGRRSDRTSQGKRSPPNARLEAPYVSALQRWVLTDIKPSSPRRRPGESSAFPVVAGNSLAAAVTLGSAAQRAARRQAEGRLSEPGSAVDLGLPIFVKGEVTVSKPRDLEKLLPNASARADFEIAVSGYAEGRLSALYA